MLYTYFTRHRLIPERLFLPPRGPVYPGLVRKFQLFVLCSTTVSTDCLALCVRCALRVA